jgi:peptidoglycan/xylan/chitin deacetylase (PgdA/CDA1 family)
MQFDAAYDILCHNNLEQIPFIGFWPQNSCSAFVLTHDVETAQGLSFVKTLADLEEEYGFRSSFNLIPERYAIDHKLITNLQARGFEVGVHGLKHDGKMFTSQRLFKQRAKRINRYLHEWGAVGFRAPLTHRNPEWMQVLEIEYDASFLIPIFMNPCPVVP